MSATTRKNKATLTRVYEEMWNQGNPSIAREIFVQPEGVEKFVSEFLRAFPDLHHTVEEMIAEDDRVAARFSAHGTHQGQWKDLAPSGRPIHYSGITLAYFRKGKIVSHHTWWDEREVIEQIK